MREGQIKGGERAVKERVPSSTKFFGEARNLDSFQLGFLSSQSFATQPTKWIWSFSRKAMVKVTERHVPRNSQRASGMADLFGIQCH